VFGKPKDKRYDKPHSPVAQPGATTEPPETISCIGPGVTVVGKFVSEGSVKIFGRFEGELQASNVLIGEGAQVEANVVAQELAIGGRFKGTIRAMHVRLLGTAVVESEIFHRSLAIEENVRFEGTSRREDDLTDKASGAQVKGVPRPATGLDEGRGQTDVKDKPDSKKLESSSAD
jgi:cytoskeletal protein CcmA (bactofilin family)